jgi:hypothetical protein
MAPNKEGSEDSPRNTGIKGSIAIAKIMRKISPRIKRMIKRLKPLLRNFLE